MNADSLPLLDPVEHAELERAAGHKLTNEEAQEFIREFYCCREHAQARLRGESDLFLDSHDDDSGLMPHQR